MSSWKSYFLEAVSLHCPTSEKYFSFNLQGPVWTSVCSEILDSPLYADINQKQSFDLGMGTMDLFVQTIFFGGIVMIFFLLLQNSQFCHNTFIIIFSNQMYLF